MATTTSRKTKSKKAIAKNFMAKNVMAKKTKAKTKTKKAPTGLSLKSERYLGLSLGGPRSDRTAVAVLEYFVEHKKLILTRLTGDFRAEEGLSSDSRLHDFISQYKSKKDLQGFGIDVPMSLPKCFRCTLKCPGIETCQEKEIRWMWKNISLMDDTTKNPRPPLPYLRRCAEVYWAPELQGLWFLGDALGANAAPLLARARYLTRRWNHSIIEVIPRLSMIRWGQKNYCSPLQLRNYRHPVNGAEARDYLLKQMAEKLNLFIYEQDRQHMVEHLSAFDSLLVALTAFWNEYSLCEAPPKGFPSTEGWITVPRG